LEKQSNGDPRGGRQVVVPIVVPYRARASQRRLAGREPTVLRIRAWSKWA